MAAEDARPTRKTVYSIAVTSRAHTVGTFPCVEDSL